MGLHRLKKERAYRNLNATGGHINPAVTLALAANRSFPWKKVPIYWFAQYLGAFLASAMVFGIYYGNSKPNRTKLFNSVLSLENHTGPIAINLKQQFNGHFRISQNATNPGSRVNPAIFANFPTGYSTAGTALAEEVDSTTAAQIHDLSLDLCRFWLRRFL